MVSINHTNPTEVIKTINLFLKKLYFEKNFTHKSLKNSLETDIIFTPLNLT